MQEPLTIRVCYIRHLRERWLPALLRSLRSQSLAFELIWRDDGSTDATKELIRGAEWLQLTEAQHSETGENMGACASFGVLMESALNSEADIFFLLIKMIFGPLTSYLRYVHDLVLFQMINLYLFTTICVWSIKVATRSHLPYGALCVWTPSRPSWLDY